MVIDNRHLRTLHLITLFSVTYNGLKTASRVVKNRGFGVGLKTVNSPTTLSLMVVIQRNVIADILPDKCTFFIENSHFAFEPPLSA